MNWTLLHGKKKAVMNAAKGLLVAFVAALTLIVLIAVFGVWTSAASIGAAVRRKSRSVKEPLTGSLSPEIEARKDAVDGQSFSCFPSGIRRLDMGAA